MTTLDDRGLPPGYPFKPEWELTPRQIKSALAAPTPLILLDCRRQSEWDTARIQGAILIPLDELAARLPEVEALADGDTTIAVHCHHGVRSLKAAAFLRQHGIHAYSMAGGIDLWSAAVDPSVPRY